MPAWLGFVFVFWLGLVFCAPCVALFLGLTCLRLACLLWLALACCCFLWLAMFLSSFACTTDLHIRCVRFKHNPFACVHVFFFGCLLRSGWPAGLASNASFVLLSSPPRVCLSVPLCVPCFGSLFCSWRWLPAGCDRMPRRGNVCPPQSEPFISLRFVGFLESRWFESDLCVFFYSVVEVSESSIRIRFCIS